MELGLNPADPVCRNIRRLGLVWNEALYRRVRRAMGRLELAREASPHISDRVPPPGIFQGDINIAVAPTPGGTATPVSIRADRLTTHTLVVGLPGGGKTWFVRWLMACLVAAYPWIRMLVFDPNDSYAAFCSNPRLWLSAPWHDLRLNPFVPPHRYAPNLWLAECVDLLSRGELMHSKYLVGTRLDMLVSEARRAAGSATDFTYPSLIDLRDDLANRKCRPGSKEDQYRESALNVLDGRVRSTGALYDCAKGMEPLLTDTRARVSTKGLSPITTLDFVVTNLIHYVCRARSIHPAPEPPQLHTLIVIEEAQSLLEHRAWGGITFYQETLLKARGLGVGFVLVTQDISHIDPLVLAAVSNHFVFAQSSARNKRAVRDTLDLSHHETGLLGELQPGECFIKFAGHPTWPHAFLARIPSHE